MNLRPFFFIGVVILFIQCQMPQKQTTPPAFPSSKQEAAAFLKQFFHPDSCKLLSKNILPNNAEIKAVFPSPVIQRQVESYIKQQKKYIICPRSEQTELLIYQVTTTDLLNDTGEAADFPSPYYNLAKHLREGLIIYRFKFVIENYQAGNSYEGLIKINGKWVIFPKIWKAFEKKK